MRPIGRAITPESMSESTAESNIRNTVAIISTVFNVLTVEEIGTTTELRNMIASPESVSISFTSTMLFAPARSV